MVGSKKFKIKNKTHSIEWDDNFYNANKVCQSIENKRIV